MSTRIAKVTPWIVALIPALVLALGDAALATSNSGISALDTAQLKVVGFVQSLAIFACIFLIGVLVWDFVQHRNIGRSIFEFLGVVLLGVIAFNAQATASFFQGSGTLIH